MATLAFNNAKVLFEGVDLTGQTNQITLEYAAEMLDATTFGQTNRIRKGGLKTARASMRGFWDVEGGTAGSGQPDQGFFDELGVDDSVLTIFPDAITEGSTSTGSGYAFKVVEATYTPLSGTVGELQPFTFTAEGRGVKA